MGNFSKKAVLLDLSNYKNYKPSQKWTKKIIDDHSLSTYNT